MSMFTTGVTPGRDTTETVLRHTSAAAGGRAEQPERAAGGGRGVQEKCGEAALHGAGSGKNKHMFSIACLNAINPHHYPSCTRPSWSLHALLFYWQLLHLETHL